MTQSTSNVLLKLTGWASTGFWSAEPGNPLQLALVLQHEIAPSREWGWEGFGGRGGGGGDTEPTGSFGARAGETVEAAAASISYLRA